MPELPDITLYIEALRERVLRRRLERSRVLSPFLLRSVEPSIRTLTLMANDPGLAKQARPLEQVVGVILGSPEFQRR